MSDRKIEGLNAALAGAVESLGNAMAQAWRAHLGHEFRAAVEKAFRPQRSGNAKRRDY